MTNLFLAAPLAKTTDEKAEYIKHKGFDNKYYQDMIVDYLEKFGQANRSDFRKLLLDKFPAGLPDKQKDRKILTLLTALKRQGIITTDSDNKQISHWILAK